MKTYIDPITPSLYFTRGGTRNILIAVLLDIYIKTTLTSESKQKFAQLIQLNIMIGEEQQVEPAIIFSSQFACFCFFGDSHHHPHTFLNNKNRVFITAITRFIYFKNRYRTVRARLIARSTPQRKKVKFVSTRRTRWQYFILSLASDITRTTSTFPQSRSIIYTHTY